MSFAVALAARAHARDGSQLNDQDTAERLKAVAGAMGESGPGMRAGPSSVSRDGVLMLTLTSPEAILGAVLTVASALRPTRTTFCAALAPLDDGPVEATLLASGAAASEAASRIVETDPTDSRMVLLTPVHGPLLSTLIDVILEAYDAMTERQRQIVKLVKHSETQQEVAKHLNISRQAVNQSLAGAGWKHLRRAEEAVLNHLGLVARSAPLTAHDTD